MAFKSSSSLLILAALICCSIGGATARRVNITYLDNCQDMGNEEPLVYLTHVDYHIDEEQMCDMVHAGLKVTTIDTEPTLLTMTLFKCEEAKMTTSCKENPVVHEELLDCYRLLHDDSGPWHMFTSAMDEGQCGDQIGVFPLSFARLRLEHLMKYLDVYDATWNTFRLEMYFKSTKENAMRGCGELDFVLMAV